MYRIRNAIAILANSNSILKPIHLNKVIIVGFLQRKTPIIWIKNTLETS
ncbi:hypothetical protein [Coleofasciculus sp. F4-SAH-05]